jgi:AraC-like DNA-binding protein
MSLFVPQKQTLTPYHELPTLTEHRSMVSLQHFELNVFETHTVSQQVELDFEGLTFTAMLRGKKVMHLFGNQDFEYLPGESVIVPSGEKMLIDFPEASEHNPTQCVAIAINNEKIKTVIDILNHQYPVVEDHLPWQVHSDQYHLTNTEDLKNAIDRLMRISLSQDRAKDILANLTLEELLVRLMQTQARCTIFENYKRYSTRNRFAYVAEYINEHLSEEISVKRMSELACMSESNFYKSFRQSFGITPTEYVLQKRMELAKKLLLDAKLSITDVCFRVGFNSVNYFCTLFRRYEKLTPSAFRASRISQPNILWTESK